MGSADSSVSPWWATSTLTSPELRWAMAAAFAKAPTSALLPEAGIIPGGGTSQPSFLPTSNGSAGAPSVSVAPGQCVVVTALGNPYVCTLPAAVTVALDTPLPSSGQTRIDMLCGRVLDTEADASGTSNVFRLTMVTGTAAASPAVPSVPAGYLPLYRITVNNAGTISAVTSLRAWTRSAGGVRSIDAEDSRAGSHVGDLRVWPSGRIDAWVSGAWKTVVSPAAWTEQTIPWTYEGTSGGGTGPSGTVNFGSGGSSICGWKRSGDDLLVRWNAVYGTGFDTGSGQLRTALPGGYTSVARRQFLPAHLYVADALTGTQTDWIGFAYIPPSSQVVYPYFPLSNSECRAFAHVVAVTPGVTGQSRPTIPGGYAAGGTIDIGSGVVQVV